MTYLIETYGCQMNKAESAALDAMFRERGWEPWQPTSAANEAMLRERGWEPWQPTSAAPDFVLINTCSVRITAENRAWGRINHWAAEKARVAREGEQRLVLAVTGCMAERLKKEIRARQPGVDLVIGTFQKQAFGLVLDAAGRGLPLEDVEESPVFVFAGSYHEPSNFRSFVPIMHGCNNYCTYCIVPHIRGREISRDPSAIISELESLEAQGVREVTFLGQNVNSYRWEGEGGPLDFPGLLSLVAERFRDRRGGGGSAHADGRDAERRGIRWIRFMTSHPKDLSDEAIAVIAREALFCRHIHLPVQAGSDRILKAMNRTYDKAAYLALIDRMRSALPGLSLTTDLLVGFPGETEEDLEETLDLMRKVRYSYAFMYHFNSREGTPAAKMSPKVPDKEKRERLARVIALQKEITGELMRSRLGAVEEVLVEDVSRRRKSEVLARTARDEMVVFPASASRIGSFATVRLEDLSGNTFRAVEL
ncbi:MAG TPA: tRNA (N6-isopentenyl adenosine(37)-C2)-methylthiotransferase MiaB [Rectinemataceae bacterium]|nr:tRNA (N6-isopentenyl adenosine(37)-C2)-methylthiotransferase MiaB [Rectinemataceae bacterium]